MRRLRLGTTGLVVALMLMMPGAASAGVGEVVDYIIGLTGPPMIGVPISCDIDTQLKKTVCHAATIVLPPTRARILANEEMFNNRQLWVSLGGGFYWSTGQDTDMGKFGFGTVKMLALEPTVNVRSIRADAGALVIEHGAALSALFIFAKDVDFSANGGLKVKWVGITRRDALGGADLGLAYNMRFFPDAFRASQFSPDGSTARHGGREFVHSFTLTVGY